MLKKELKNDHQPDKSTFNKLDTKIDYKAMILFTIDENGKWMVTRLVAKHNHELAKLDERYLLRSIRSFMAIKVGIIDFVVNAGIQTVDVYSYMVEEVGGVENQSFSELFKVQSYVG